MEQKKQYFCLPLFAGTAAVAYIQCCTLYAVVWAGFNGFGGIWMDYTQTGENLIGSIVLFWFLMLLLIPAVHMIKRHKRKEPVKYYLGDIGFWILGIMAGILVFFGSLQSSGTIIDGMKHLIREAGWLEYPIP